SDAEWAKIREQTSCEPGDLLLCAADEQPLVEEVLGALRLRLGRELGLSDCAGFRLACITGFPLLGERAEEGRYAAMRLRGPMPGEEDVPLLETDRGKVRAQAYDLVLNGYEIGGGSRRVHRREVQEAMFRALGISQEEARNKFGFLLEAFEYGAPPHGGIAFGFDRIVMLLAGCSNLRDCIAFPKTASGSCLLTGAPAPVDENQLKELHIAVTDNKMSKENV